MNITETDLAVLRKCFLDSLNVVEHDFCRDQRFLLKSSWSRNSDKVIGILKDDTYFVYGYPKTNSEIVKYLMEHGHPHIVIKNMSDEPEKPRYLL